MELPKSNSLDKLTVDRKTKKDTALRARRRAAMALLKAERLMQAYAEEFGEDTEWEEEEEDEFVP